MITDNSIQHRITFDSGAVTGYLILPTECTLRDVTSVVQADPGDGDTITITGGGSVASGASGATNALGLITFGSGLAAGAAGAWSGDATTGNMTLLSGSLLKMVTSAAAPADCDLNIKIDPYALG